MLSCQKQVYCSGSDFSELARDTLQNGASLRFSAPGTSMLPWIHDGDLLWVSSCLFSELRLGDIVLFERTEGCLNAHRVIQICRHEEQPYLVTMGDNALFPDGRVSPERILGKIVSVERDGQLSSVTTWMNRWRALAKSRCRWFMLRLVRVWERGRRFSDCWIFCRRSRAGSMEDQEQ